MSINLFEKQNKKETSQITYPIPTTTKVVGGGFSVMVEKVDEKKQTVTVAWLDENGEKMRGQTLTLAEYNNLGDDTTAVEEHKEPEVKEIEVTNQKTQKPNTNAPVQKLNTPPKKTTDIEPKNGAVPKVKEELEKVFIGKKDGFLVKKGFVFKTVDAEYNLVDITINTIKKIGKNIELTVTIAGNGKEEIATITADDLNNIRKKSEKNKKALEEIQATKLTMRNKNGKLQILERKPKEEKIPVVTDEAINLEKSLVYEERVNNAIATRDEDTMALLQQEIFEVREKYEKLQQTKLLVAKLDELYRTLDNARTETLDTKDVTTPLGFSVGETISVFGTLYNVVSYDPTKKKYVLKNEVTKEIKDELESSLKFAWSYPVEEKSADTTLPVAPEAGTSTDETKENDTVNHPAVQRIQNELEAIQKKLAVTLPKEAVVLAKKRTQLERQLQNLEIALDTTLNEVEKIGKIFESGFDAYAISNHDQDTDVAIQVLSLMQKDGKHIVSGKEENMGHSKTIAEVSSTPQLWLQIDRGGKNGIDISVDEIGNVIVTVDHHEKGGKIAPTSAAEALYFFLKSRGYSLPPIELFGPKGSNPVSIHENTFEQFLGFINVQDNLLYNQTRDDLQRTYPGEYQLLQQKLTPEEVDVFFSPNNSIQKLKTEHAEVYEKLTKKTTDEDKVLSEYELNYFFTPTYNLDQLRETYPVSLPGIMHLLPGKEVLRIFALLGGDPYRRFTDEELHVKIRDNGGFTKSLEKVTNKHKEGYVEPAIEMFEFLEKKSLERWGGISDQFGPTLLITETNLGIPSQIAYAKGYQTLVLLNPAKKSLSIFSHSPNMATAHERIVQKIPSAVFPRGTMIIVPPGQLIMTRKKEVEEVIDGKLTRITIEEELSIEEIEEVIADIMGLHKETSPEPLYSAGDVGVRTGEDVSFDMPQGKNTKYSSYPPLRPGDTEQAKPDKGDGRMIPNAKPTAYSSELPKKYIAPEIVFDLPKVDMTADELEKKLKERWGDL